MPASTRSSSGRRRRRGASWTSRSAPPTTRCPTSSSPPSPPPGLGRPATPGRPGEAVAWARARGVIGASDGCYGEFNWDDVGDPAAGATALAGGTDGVLAVHSLSKRSNMAGYRCGFLAGDGDLVAYIGSVRTPAGVKVPGPLQAAAPAAWADDAPVEVQRARHPARPGDNRARLAQLGLVDAGGPSSFYL